MDAIVMAGGKGTRMMPLTANTPKPLLPVGGVPILEWTLRNLQPVVTRVIMVVSYLKPQIEMYMAAQTIFDEYVLVEQLPQPLGTGHAVVCCRPYLQSDQFIVLNGDDLFSASAIKQLAHTSLGLLGVERENASQYGVIVTDETARVLRLHEKPPADLYPSPVLVNIGAYKFDARIFDYDVPISARGEYEITDTVSWLAQRAQVQAVRSDFWFPIGTPENLRDAQSLDPALFSPIRY